MNQVTAITEASVGDGGGYLNVNFILLRKIREAKQGMDDTP